MLVFGRVGSSWGHRAYFGSLWGEKVITPKFEKKIGWNNLFFKLLKFIYIYKLNI
jgi:hypothetical protein